MDHQHGIAGACLGGYHQGRSAFPSAFAEAIGVAKPAAPVDRVNETIQASQRLAERVATLVDRIVGSVPVPQNSSVAHIGQPGVIGGLVTSAEEASGQIASANDALDRLARAFGL